MAKLFAFWYSQEPNSIPYSVELGGSVHRIFCYTSTVWADEHHVADRQRGVKHLGLEDKAGLGGLSCAFEEPQNSSVGASL